MVNSNIFSFISTGEKNGNHLEAVPKKRRRKKEAKKGGRDRGERRKETTH